LKKIPEINAKTGQNKKDAKNEPSGLFFKKLDGAFKNNLRVGSFCNPDWRKIFKIIFHFFT